MKKKLSPKELYWQNHIRTFLNSGLKQVDYCKEHNLNAKTFSVRKSEYFRHNDNIENESSNNFVPLNNKKNISIKLSNGVELSFDHEPDPVWMGAVLGSLENLNA